MKKVTTKVVALAVAVATMTTMLSSAFGADTKVNAATKTITYRASDTYYIGDNVRGYYTEPVEKGKYQTAVVIHGNGSDCASWLQEQMPKAMEYWVNQGYLEPMEIVMPWIPHYNGDDTEGITGHKLWALNYTDDLANNLSNISTKADLSKNLVITGYSMGGSDALAAAALNPNLYKEVGALSSSYNFIHPDNPKRDDSFFSSTSQMNFNKDTRAYITYGVREPAPFASNAERFYGILHDTFKLDTIKYACKNTNWGGHGNPLFLREIFMYFYYLQHGVVLPEADVEKACAPVYTWSGRKAAAPASKNDHHPYTEPIPSEQPLKVSAAKTNKANVKYQESYTVSVDVTGGTGKYTYDWYYSTEKYGTYKQTILKDKDGNLKNGKSSLTIDSATCDIYYKCKVSDGNTTITSDPVMIHVAPRINSITSNGYNVKLEAGKTYQITVNASGQNLVYQWEYSLNGRDWIKSTNKGCKSKTVDYVNNPQFNVKVIYYRCTVTSMGSSSQTTIKLGK